MGAARIKAVEAWIDEQVASGTLDKKEIGDINDCLAGKSGVAPLVEVTRRIGDFTPLEILVGERDRDDQRASGGRPFFDTR